MRLDTGGRWGLLDTLCTVPVRKEQEGFGLALQPTRSHTHGDPHAPVLQVDCLPTYFPRDVTNYLPGWSASRTQRQVPLYCMARRYVTD